MFGKNKNKNSKTIRVPRPSKSTQRIHSYYTAQQVDSDSTKYSKRRSVTKKNILKSAFLQRLSILVFVIFVAFTASVLSDEPIISFGGSQTITSVDRYAQDVQSQLGSSFLNANKFTLRRSSIEKTIKEKFPELKSVDISTVVLGKKPLVRLELYDLPLVYGSNREEYIVASNGAIVGKRGEFPLAKNMLVVQDDSGIAVEKSDIVLRSDDVAFLGTLTTIMEAKGRGVERVRITSIPREIFVKPTDKNYEIRMYLDENPAQQIGSWFSVEKVVGESGVGQPSQYIDVRAGEKVYWL